MGIQHRISGLASDSIEHRTGGARRDEHSIRVPIHEGGGVGDRHAMDQRLGHVPGARALPPGDALPGVVMATCPGDGRTRADDAAPPAGRRPDPVEMSLHGIAAILQVDLVADRIPVEGLRELPQRRDQHRLSAVFHTRGLETAVTTGEPVVQNRLHASDIACADAGCEGGVAAGSARREGPESDQPWILHGEASIREAEEQAVEFPGGAAVFALVCVVETDPDQGLGLDRRISG